MSMPPDVSAVIGRNAAGPQNVHVISGAGVPGSSLSLTNGTSQSVSGMLNGIGMGGFAVTHTANTSNMDQISNPRAVVATQYFIDTDLTNIDADIGDMEMHWMDIEAGRPGIVGQARPHVFKTLPRLNHWLSEPQQRREFGEMKDTRWFDFRFRFAGIMRHEDTKGRIHAEQGNICQLFATAGRVRVADMWQSFASKQSPQGPEIGDLIQVVLRKYEMKDSIALSLGSPSTMEHKYYWQLVPYFCKNNAEIPKIHLYDKCTKTMGACYKIGRVASIYGTANNPGASRSVARQIVFSPTSDGSYKRNLIKLRQLEIEVMMT